MIPTPWFSDASQGETVFIGQDNLYPGDDPRHRAVEKARQIPLEQGVLYVIASPLLGYGIPEFAARLPAGSIFVAVELLPALTLHTRLPPEIPLWYPHGNEPMSDLARRILDGTGTLRGIRRVVLVSLNRGARHASALYRELELCLQGNLLNYWRNRSTVLYHGRRWVLNFLDKLKHGLIQPLVPGSMLRGKSVAICGAGPSLDRSMDDLLRHRDHWFIVCVDTALPALLARGVKPDVCVVVEGQWHNLQDFILEPIPPSVVFWVDLWAHGPTLRYLKQKGHKLRFFASLFQNDASIPALAARLGVPTVPALGSVGICALWLSLKMCHDAAAYVIHGLDFQPAMAQGHARSSPSHMAGLRTWSRTGPHSWLSSNWFPFGDKVLESYGKLAREALACFPGEYERLYDARSSGIDLGLKAWKSIVELSSISGGVDPAVVTASLAPEGTLPEIRTWLVGCLDRLEDALHAKSGYQGFDGTLEELSWMYADFPDVEWPPRSEEAIARVLSRTRYYRECLG